MKKQLLAIEEVLKKSEVALPISLKMKLAELILGLSLSRKRFGLFVIFGWQSGWRKFTDIPDSSQDIFLKRRVNVKNLQFGKQKHYDIATTINFDGAILINRRGNIVHSGVMLEGLRPRIVADKINPGRFDDLSEQFGFKQKVHLRHLNAITASYVFKGTTVFTVSEETGSFHVFEKGGIIYSTVSDERGNLQTF